MTYYAHAAQEVGRDGANDDAVVVVVERLHFGKVGAYAVVNIGGRIGKEYRLLYARAAFALKIFHDVVAHFIALDVIHYKK